VTRTAVRPGLGTRRRVRNNANYKLYSRISRHDVTPEGWQIVAQRASAGIFRGSRQSPGGAALRTVIGALCRPSGAIATLRDAIPRTASWATFCRTSGAIRV